MRKSEKLRAELRIAAGGQYPERFRGLSDEVAHSLRLGERRGRARGPGVSGPGWVNVRQHGRITSRPAAPDRLQV